MKHRKEIERWAKCPDGTKVWYKTRHGKDEWKLGNCNFNDNDGIYIVDDEYAEVRIARYSTTEPKTEPEYYYQYERKAEGYIFKSRYHYTDEYALELNYTEGNGWFKIKSSKRTWEY